MDLESEIREWARSLDIYEWSTSDLVVESWRRGFKVGEKAGVQKFLKNLKAIDDGRNNGPPRFYSIDELEAVAGVSEVK